jgi:hypothetical protein
MSCLVSSRPVSMSAEQCLEGAMFGGVVGGSVLPAVPDDAEVVAGEVGDHVAAFIVCGTTESDVFDFSGLAGGRCDSSQEGQRLGGLEHDLQVRAQLVGHSDSVRDEIDRPLSEGSQ